MENFLSVEFITHIIYGNSVHSKIKNRQGGCHEDTIVTADGTNLNLEFLIEHRVSVKQAKALVTEYSPARVSKNIEAAISDYAKKMITDRDFNAGGALYQAIEDDWAKVSSAQITHPAIDEKTPVELSKQLPSATLRNIFISALDEGSIKVYVNGKRRALSKSEGDQMNTAVRMFLHGIQATMENC